jgi:hypothetical protein
VRKKPLTESAFEDPGASMGDSDGALDGTVVARKPTGQAMASITALLVVLTLTGEPVANALCTIWCDTASEKHSCGEAIARATAPDATVTATDCATIVTVPFLREEGRVASRVGAVATLPSAAVPPAASRSLPAPGRDGTSDGWPKPPLVLRV